MGSNYSFDGSNYLEWPWETCSLEKQMERKDQLFPSSLLNISSWEILKNLIEYKFAFRIEYILSKLRVF